VYHFMFGPEWQEGCPSCSMVADNFDGVVTHLANRDVTLVAVSRAPISRIAAFKERMGWRFKWVSSYGNDFNLDYHVSFAAEEVAQGMLYYNYTTQAFPRAEAHAASVFYKDAEGNIFHTYSSYGRGVETFLGPYNYLDITPKGRDEDGLSFPLAWVRHHDRYRDNYFSEKKPQHSAASGAQASCCAEHG